MKSPSDAVAARAMRALAWLLCGGTAGLGLFIAAQLWRLAGAAP